MAVENAVIPTTTSNFLRQSILCVVSAITIDNEIKIIYFVVAAGIGVDRDENIKRVNDTLLQ